jgi:hypothetical protein
MNVKRRVGAGGQSRDPCGVVALVRSADQLIAGAQGTDKFGRAGEEGNDSHDFGQANRRAAPLPARPARQLQSVPCHAARFAIVPGAWPRSTRRPASCARSVRPSFSRCWMRTGRWRDIFWRPAARVVRRVAGIVRIRRRLRRGKKSASAADSVLNAVAATAGANRSSLARRRSSGWGGLIRTASVRHAWPNLPWRRDGPNGTDGSRSAGRRRRRVFRDSRETPCSIWPVNAG